MEGFMGGCPSYPTIPPPPRRWLLASPSLNNPPLPSLSLSLSLSTELGNMGDDDEAIKGDCFVDDSRQCGGWSRRVTRRRGSSDGLLCGANRCSRRRDAAIPTHAWLKANPSPHFVRLHATCSMIFLSEASFHIDVVFVLNLWGLTWNVWGMFNPATPRSHDFVSLWVGYLWSSEYYTVPTWYERIRVVTILCCLWSGSEILFFHNLFSQINRPNVTFEEDTFISAKYEWC